MTTLEKAKRFRERIKKWVWYRPGADWHHIDEKYPKCVSRVYRALLRQLTKRIEHGEEFDGHALYVRGLTRGLRIALELFDAVHGRKKDEDDNR